MFRIRALIWIVLFASLAYALSPAHRKQRIKDKLREIWVATVLGIILYWVYMLGAFAWKRWGG